MEIVQQLFNKASAARFNAYAPYSHYFVGAAIYSENKKIYASCNVENISFPCGTCAEAGAISAMVSGGDKKIKKILVISDAKELVYPCGACLQRIAEFSDKDTMIYLADIKEVKKIYKLHDLLPYNFEAKELSDDQRNIRLY